jgi:hypothetical protein
MHSLRPIIRAPNHRSRGSVAFKRYPPPLGTRNLVESIWTFSAGASGCGLTDCIPPDIGSEIICRTGSEPFVLIPGPQLRHEEISITPGAHYVGARLKPGVASWLLKAPAKDVCGSRVDLATEGAALCRRNLRSPDRADIKGCRRALPRGTGRAVRATRFSASSDDWRGSGTDHLERQRQDHR